ncbi:MAG TPA: alpha-L-arabinofuranosidase C-terminal domain-containing protein [Phnomibacter sp.]|nr:alpha-L-arabinofuranosidase C-terminal domain-containing protein [Phnomibacter sp.]
MKPFKILTAALASVSLLQASAQNNNTIVVKPNQLVATVQPTMWGVFFEDINLGADGGIYAELVKNRSFEFSKPLMGWKVDQQPFKEGAVLVLNRKEDNTANPRYIRVTANNTTAGSLSFTNEGFRGMGIKKDNGYDFSVNYHTVSGQVKLHVELVTEKGETIGSTIVTPAATSGEAWSKATASFTATTTEPKAKLKIWVEGTGVIDLDMISLFPKDTWKNRPGGMRADMIQMLADMKPGFIRFPGGCIVEGYDLSQRYQWKKTIGPIEERQLIINRWNFEFSHRPTPDYFQTFGLGFFEYFQLSEDIGAEPLPILNSGMACQFNTAEVVELDELQPYIQDALDLIEFANGDITTTWGKKRADMGHAAPFNLKFLGVGNENWGPQYVERLKLFKQAIKAKYPNMQLVTSSGTDPNGERFDYLNKELRVMNADIIDEHYYRKPEWFLENARRYDSYDRNGSKVFAGEYAAQTDKTVSVENANNWKGAISEAAFMTGLERNAGVVNMASYAPLFAHIDGWQWKPDMIWVNNLQVFGTPNYYVQKLYSLNKGTNVVPVTLNNDVIAGQDSLYASAVVDSKTNEVVVKLVNASGKSQSKTLQFEGLKKLPAEALLTVLKANLGEVNNFSTPQAVAPAESKMQLKGKSVTLEAAPYSMTVFRMKLK